MTAKSAGHAALDLLTDTLAVYRLTRLITGDSITHGLRLKIQQAEKRRIDAPDFDRVAYTQRWGPEIGQSGFYTTLTNCPWCTGWHVAGGVALLRAAAPLQWSRIARPLAMSAVAAFLQGRE